MRVVWILTILSGTTIVSCETTTKATELLPKPEPLRYERRGQTRRRYDVLDRRKNAPTSRLAEEFIDDSDRIDDQYTSASEYGGYTSETGHGHQCAAGYINASAVALLAFLFLLNIVQDIVTQITMANRRKRDADFKEQDPVMQFIQDGGLDALKEGLPPIVLPLMLKLADSPTTKCMEKSLCESNYEITSKYGETGKVISALLSNVISSAFGRTSVHEMGRLQNAAYVGRQKMSCDKLKECTENDRHHILYNNIN